MTDPTPALVLPLLTAFLLPLFARDGLRWLAPVLGPAVLALCAMLLFGAWSAFETPYTVALGGFAAPLGIVFYVDRLALLFALAVPLATLLLWPGATDAEAPRRHALTLLLAAALIGLALSGDLFNLYVFYELAAVASYGLVAANGTGAAHLAAFRYLLIGAIGSVIGLFGIALIYFQTGTLNLAHLATFADELGRPPGLAAFAMLLIGFGVKAEMFPVNAWVPEVYAAATRRVSALLAGLASKLAVLVIVRVLLLVFPHDAAHELLLVLGILGVLSGELAAWQARDVARMLAWSSIGQLGVVLVAFSLPGPTGVIAGVTVAMHHLVVKSALFLLAGRWGGAPDALRGAAAVSPIGAALFVLFAMSLLGMPPLPGFWSKYLVLTGLAESASAMHALAMAVVLLGTVLEGAYLLRVATALYARGEPTPTVPSPGRADLFGSGVLAALLLAAALYVNPLWLTLDQMARVATDRPAYVETVFGNSGNPR